MVNSIVRKDLGVKSSKYPLVGIDITGEPQHLGAIIVWGDGEEEAQQRAALIVTAVNAHDRYESALRIVKTWLISPDLSPDTLAQIRETVNGALGA